MFPSYRAVLFCPHRELPEAKANSQNLLLEQQTGLVVHILVTGVTQAPTISALFCEPQISASLLQTLQSVSLSICHHLPSFPRNAALGEHIPRHLQEPAVSFQD